MGKKHLFILDPLASLNLALDSSLRMAFELARIGGEIFVCEPRQMGWAAPGEGIAQAAQLSFTDSPAKFAASTASVRPLSEFAAIHMRKDPPYDLDYITTTWLIDAAGPKTQKYNEPKALRSINEKLAIFRFPEASRPALASADPDALMRFVEAHGGDAVLKPLTLFGGRGVIRLQLADGRETVRKVLAQETGDGSQIRMIQQFDSAVFAGEVRAFTAFGKPVAWCLKRPAAGNFLANTRAGATIESYRPSDTEVRRVTEIAVALMREGVALIGFDLIGGFVSEVNITSPRLLVAPGDSANPYAAIAREMQDRANA